MDTLPYHQIPAYPMTYTAATVAARMLDGLGYRFYWVSKDLRPEDLAYKPSEDGRTIEETMQHIYGLSKTTLNAIMTEPNVRSATREELNYEQLREKTLLNIKAAADHLRNNPEIDLNEAKIIFQRGEKVSEFPFWNLLNGHIADAIYHTGQVVAFRRASGNPQQSGVSVFSGKTRE